MLTRGGGNGYEGLTRSAMMLSVTLSWPQLPGGVGRNGDWTHFWFPKKIKQNKTEGIPVLSTQAKSQPVH